MNPCARPPSDASSGAGGRRSTVVHRSRYTTRLASRGPRPYQGPVDEAVARRFGSVQRRRGADLRRSDLGVQQRTVQREVEAVVQHGDGGQPQPRRAVDVPTTLRCRRTRAGADRHRYAPPRRRRIPGHRHPRRDLGIELQLTTEGARPFDRKTGVCRAAHRGRSPWWTFAASPPMVHDPITCPDIARHRARPMPDRVHPTTIRHRVSHRDDGITPASYRFQAAVSSRRPFAYFTARTLRGERGGPCGPRVRASPASTSRAASRTTA